MCHVKEDGLPVPVPISRTSWKNIRDGLSKIVIGCAFTNLYISRNRRKEELAIKEDHEIVMASDELVTRCVTRQRPFSNSREIDRSLLLLVVWSEVLSRMAGAMVSTPLDCPVL
jgi:hypothetical protein